MKMSRQVSSLPARFLMIAGIVVSLILLALIYWFGPAEYVIVAAAMGFPSVALLAYFALGGDISVKLRQKGYNRYMLFGLVGWASILAGIVAMHFLFGHG